MIEKLENVTAIAKANVYFDGKVVSHTVYMENGDRKTLGLFLPGEYEFGTGDAEIMDLTDGVCQVLLPGSSEWQELKAGETFNIPANSKFCFRCYVPVQYVCSYVKA
ncbi:MAG: pyrimidine/purine nucleoside phosphorylase [Cloacibacillus porcorum]|uniref:pyrimidine/purine nucleoside phosphorylase n=1 Tax=Cloacibacillus porcorum TaxID=1197717 RepID=UPI0023F4E7CA|nr:pyrimidine/purine nucleoside phosphorylase [Cloacibacillus porcorum]MCD7877720.1 pyrimidine/purine nucleoside phosphorylase [Cloacibacillus porcorum]